MLTCHSHFYIYIMLILHTKLHFSQNFIQIRQYTRVWLKHIYTTIMGRYANYHIALMLSLIYGPPMLLCAVYLYFHKKEQNVLTINGSLLGGIKKSQWRHNLLHAADSEFRLLYKIERRVWKENKHTSYMPLSILPILIFLLPY